MAEDFLGRLRRGEAATISEYELRRPDQRREIREVLEAMLLLERVRPAPEDASGVAARLPEVTASGKLEQIGEYRILREIGRGGMGIVYEAEQVSLGRHVAIKLLPAQALLDSKQLRRFQHEAKAAARLHHTNIVPVFGVGEAEGFYYYVMQFIPGLGLDQVLAELRASRERAPESSSPSETALETEMLSSSGGATYPRAVARIGAQVAEALEYAASQGVLHRDIKPSNLLLDGRGNVWITDFGLAKASGLDDLTQAGDIIGTLRYMAPERFSGDADIRSDVYSIGLTLYELLTLEPAFAQKSRQELMRQILEESPPSLEKKAPGTPRDLVTIVEKAMARRPEDRYATPGALAADLRRFQDDRPIEARRLGRPERLWRWCRRNPVVATLATAVLALAISAGVLALEERKAREVARLAEKKSVTTDILTIERSRRADEARIVADFLAREVVFSGASPHGHFPRPPALDALARAEPKIPEMFKDLPLGEAALRFRLGKSYYRIGELDRAHEHLQRAYDLRRSFQGPEHYQTLEAMDFLALTLREEGKLAEARELREGMLRALNKDAGESDEQTITCRTGLMLVLKDQGDLERARAICEDIIATEERGLGPDHPRTLEHKEHLAFILRAQGELQAAQALLEEVLETRRRTDGVEGRRTLSTASRYMLLLKDLGHLDEAKAVGVQTLSSQVKVLGEMDGDSVFTMSNLAFVARLLGQPEEARAYCERTLEQGHCFFVSEHPDARDSETLRAVEEFIDAFEASSKLDMAEILTRELLAVHARFSGWQSPMTLAAQKRLVHLLGAQGKAAEAADLRQAIEAAKRVGGL